MPTLSGRYASMDKSDLGMDWARQGLNVAQQLLAQKSGKYTHKKSDLSKRERYGIDFAKQSYTAPGDRVKKLHGYTLVDKYSSEKYAVYERKGKYQVAVRGTVPGHKLTEKSGDILQDMEILKGNGPQIQVNEAKALIQQIITDNPGAKGNIGLNSHSLGARINLELLHDNPENFSDSVSLAPGMSPLGSKEDQEHMKALVQDNTSKNKIIGIANDAVWSGAAKHMEGQTNVKILPAVDSSITGMANNHFLSAFDPTPLAHERMKTLLEKHGFSKSDVDKHVAKIKNLDEKKGHAKVDKTEAALTGGSMAQDIPKKVIVPKQLSYGYDTGFDHVPPWHRLKKKRSIIVH